MSLRLGDKVIAGVISDASAFATKTELNNKVNKSDLTEVVVLKTSYVNGTSGYNIWSNGYCEQWGNKVWNGAWDTTTFLKKFRDTNYTIVATGWRTDASPYQGFCSIKDLTTTSCNMWFSDDSTSNPCNVRWKASGYLAEGQY